MSEIELRDLSKTFGDEDRPKDVLRSLSLKIREGEILGIVGTSGSGKTTLLNLIAGLDRPTRGRITVGGQPLTGVNAHSVMVFQMDAVFPFLTVGDNVAYGIEDAEQRNDVVQRYLELVGLRDEGGRWPRELSVGMRKRVEVARAYARSSQILLMDEPFGALDVLTKEDMQELLLTLWQRERRTIIFVTHDVEEAIFLAHRVLILTPSYPVVDVPFAHPRTADLKLTSPFLDLRRKITHQLAHRALAAPTVGDNVIAV